MPLWLGQRLNKDYLPSAENMNPTKRGRCSRPGWLAVPALPSALWGHPTEGIMSQWVKPHLCWWWGLGDGCPWTPGCLLQGSRAAWSQESQLGIALVETRQKTVLWGSSQATPASGQCMVTNLCELCLLQGHGVVHLVLLNPRAPQTGVLGVFRGWI